MPRLSRVSCRASFGSRVKMVPTVFSVLMVIFHVSAHSRSSSRAVCTFASAAAMLLSVAQTARLLLLLLVFPPSGVSRT